MKNTVNTFAKKDNANLVKAEAKAKATKKADNEKKLAEAKKEKLVSFNEAKDTAKSSKEYSYSLKAAIRTIIEAGDDKSNFMSGFNARKVFEAVVASNIKFHHTTTKEGVKKYSLYFTTLSLRKWINGLSEEEIKALKA